MTPIAGCSTQPLGGVGSATSQATCTLPPTLLTEGTHHINANFSTSNSTYADVSNGKILGITISPDTLTISVSNANSGTTIDLGQYSHPMAGVALTYQAILKPAVPSVFMPDGAIGFSVVTASTASLDGFGCSTSVGSKALTTPFYCTVPKKKVKYGSFWMTATFVLSAGTTNFESPLLPGSYLQTVTWNFPSAVVSASPTPAPISTGVTLIVKVTSALTATITPQGIYGFRTIPGCTTTHTPVSLVVTPSTSRSATATCHTTDITLGSDSVYIDCGTLTNPTMGSCPTNHTVYFTVVTSNPSVTVSMVRGSMTYGSSTPVFLGTYSAPTGFSVSGTIQCSKTSTGAAIDSSLGVGTYSITGSSCSGLSSSPSGFTFTYTVTALSFNVSAQEIVIATVAGKSTYDSNAATFSGTISVPSDAHLSGTITCQEITKTTESITKNIPPLRPGSYTILVSSCLSPSVTSNFVLSFRAKINGLVVTKATYVIGGIGGSLTYGTTTPSFSTTSSLPVGVLGKLVCHSVASGAKVGKALTGGFYTLKKATCGGLSMPTGFYVFTYTPGVNAFEVNPIAIPVTDVAGTMVYGSTSPTFSGTHSNPRGLKITGVLECSQTLSRLPISSTLTVGTYTPSVCGGFKLTTAEKTNYSFSYVTKKTGFSVTVAPITIQKISGTITQGSSLSERFSVTVAAIPLTADLTIRHFSCSEVTKTTKLLPTLSAGLYSLKAKTCSGATSNSNYLISYSTRATGFKVSLHA